MGISHSSSELFAFPFPLSAPVLSGRWAGKQTSLGAHLSHMPPAEMQGQLDQEVKVFLQRALERESRDPVSDE